MKKTKGRVKNGKLIIRSGYQIKTKEFDSFLKISKISMLDELKERQEELADQFEHKLEVKLTSILNSFIEGFYSGTTFIREQMKERGVDIPEFVNEYPTETQLDKLLEV